MHFGRLQVSLAVAVLTALLSAISAAPTAATPSSRLDEQGFWKAWVLFEDPAVQHSEETGRRKGQIMPKSIFIAPVVKDQMPDCAPGYQADALGRCNKLVKVNQNAQLGFLLQKLNAMYGGANSEKFSAPKKPTTTEGPLQLSIPLDGGVRVENLTTTTTTESPPTTTEPTEVAEVMVVAAQVEFDDETKSTALPGAIVTLWHVNNDTTLTTTLPEVTETDETVTPTEMTTPPVDLEEEETTPPPIELEEVISASTIPPVEEDEGTTLVTTTSPEEEDSIVATTTPKTPWRRPALPDPVKIISKPADPDQVAVIEAEFLPEELEEPDAEVGTPTPLAHHESQSSPVILDRPYPPAFQRPSQSEVVLTDLSVGNSSPNGQWGRPSAKLEQTPPVVPSPDRIIFPDEKYRNGGKPWAWGNWEQTTPRPLLLNFYSHLPQVSHNQGGGGRRTHLSHSNLFPAPGRQTPLYYQELSGHDVANVLGRPWRHYRNQYRH